MSNFRKALIFTTVPIVVLSLISIGGAVSDNHALRMVELGAVALWVIAIVVGIVYTIKGIKQTAAGIWAGVGIGAVSLSATCFANTFI